MNLSLQDVGGELLIVPNFTLYGDARRADALDIPPGAAPDVAAGLFAQLFAKSQNHEHQKSRNRTISSRYESVIG